MGIQINNVQKLIKAFSGDGKIDEKEAQELKLSKEDTAKLNSLFQQGKLKVGNYNLSKNSVYVAQQGDKKYRVKGSKTGRFYIVGSDNKTRYYTANGLQINEKAFCDGEGVVIKNGKMQKKVVEKGFLARTKEVGKAAVNTIKSTCCDENGNFSVKKTAQTAATVALATAALAGLNAVFVAAEAACVGSVALAPLAAAIGFVHANLNTIVIGVFASYLIGKAAEGAINMANAETEAEAQAATKQMGEATGEGIMLALMSGVAKVMAKVGGGKYTSKIISKIKNMFKQAPKQSPAAKPSPQPNASVQSKPVSGETSAPQKALPQGKTSAKAKPAAGETPAPQKALPKGEAPVQPKQIAGETPAQQKALPQGETPAQPKQIEASSQQKALPEGKNSFTPKSATTDSQGSKYMEMMKELRTNQARQAEINKQLSNKKLPKARREQLKKELGKLRNRAKELDETIKGTNTAEQPKNVSEQVKTPKTENSAASENSSAPKTEAKAETEPTKNTSTKPEAKVEEKTAANEANSNKAPENSTEPGSPKLTEKQQDILRKIELNKNEIANAKNYLESFLTKLKTETNPERIAKLNQRVADVKSRIEGLNKMKVDLENQARELGIDSKGNPLPKTEAKSTETNNVRKQLEASKEDSVRPNGEARKKELPPSSETPQKRLEGPKQASQKRLPEPSEIEANPVVEPTADPIPTPDPKVTKPSFGLVAATAGALYEAPTNEEEISVSEIETVEEDVTIPTEEPAEETLEPELTNEPIDTEPTDESSVNTDESDEESISSEDEVGNKETDTSVDGDETQGLSDVSDVDPPPSISPIRTSDEDIETEGSTTDGNPNFTRAIPAGKKPSKREINGIKRLVVKIKDSNGKDHFYEVDPKDPTKMSDKELTVDKRGIFRKKKFYNVDGLPQEIDVKTVKINGQKVQIFNTKVNKNEKFILNINDDVCTKGEEVLKTDNGWMLKSEVEKLEKEKIVKEKMELNI